MVRQYPASRLTVVVLGRANMRQTAQQNESVLAATSSAANLVALSHCVMFCCICVILAGCAATAMQAPSPAEAAAAAAAAPPPYAGPTIPKLLGVQDCAKVAAKCTEKLCTCLKQQFPGPGAGAPSLGEVGPKSSPAAKCAAEIIAAEALAPQTIDAIRYLGLVGCTKCYPCVEEGLLAALEDCTEPVRFEAAKALRRTASEKCQCCQYTSCCTQKVYEKLYKIAYETRPDGCPVEPSNRVRRVARRALCLCGGPMVSDDAEPTPAEGPSGAAPPSPTPAAPPTEPSAPAATATATVPAAPASLPPNTSAGADDVSSAVNPDATAISPPQETKPGPAAAPVEPAPLKEATATNAMKTSSSDPPPVNPLRTAASGTWSISHPAADGPSLERPTNPFRRGPNSPPASGPRSANLTRDIKKPAAAGIANR
jgi:hypothetical protein